LRISRENSCPFLASRWDREQRGVNVAEENACYLWEDSGIPPDVLQYGGGVGRWRGEPYVPVPVEMQYTICTQPHYGTCRWLREHHWHTREAGLVCPLLGSKDDRHHKYLYPTHYNVCHGELNAGEEHKPIISRLVNRVFRYWLTIRRAGRVTALSLESQRGVCLTQGYNDCPRYQRSHRI
jgi:hypothetical protein